MTENQVRLTIGALLHDVGKVIYIVEQEMEEITVQVERIIWRTKLELKII